MNTTRQSLVFTLIITVLVILILLMGFGIIGPGGKQEGSKTVASQAESVNPSDFEYHSSDVVSIEESPVPDMFSKDELATISVYDRLNQAVVNITTEVLGYNWFLEAVPRQGSSGSGTIIDTRGYILTNNHVVENAYKVNVTLADGDIFEGEVIGSDPENDLAVVYFDPGDNAIVTIPFGDSRNLRVGQKVLAIGNPFGFQRTLTTGIISGLGRPLKNDRGIVIRDLIQTDASINPGNSGGPLLDSRGNLIGVNTIIYTPSGGSVGIGFAVPVQTASRVVPDLILYGYVQRGWIDIEPVQLFPSLVRYAGLPVGKGILVSRVTPSGNAEEAGLRGGKADQAVRSGNTLILLGGDIIIGINGEPVATLGDLYTALEDSSPGDSASLKILRGRRELDIDIILSAREGSGN